MSEQEFYRKLLKWRHDPYSGGYRAQLGDTKYRIVREDDGLDGRGWLVCKAEAGRGERYLRPLCKTVKLAKERAEVDAYWDDRKRREEQRAVEQLKLRAEADASDHRLAQR